MINTIDLFAGCGGLTEGFKQSGNYNTIACVEWDKVPCKTLQHRMQSKWGYKDADERVLRFDIQRTKELFNGWDDEEYGSSSGLDTLVDRYAGHVDLIIGGPPCQAYSVAGRIRDENGMRDDYRNYLFENYIDILVHYTPKAFIFENVPGMLSATPGDSGLRIVDRVQKRFYEAGYTLLSDLNEALIDLTEYGVPQNRKRIIILGLSRSLYGGKADDLIKKFYKEILTKHKITKKKTVRDAIDDLPKLYPLDNPIIVNGKRYSHSLSENNSIRNHTARYNNHRDINVFKMLAEDIENERFEYTSTDALKKLYTSLTGCSSNVHKYYVLRWDEQSNTIPAHLFKDGLRHIHPDSEQARSITVREAARLQTFPDDFEFISNSAIDYKMIGNAVPPKFSYILAESLKKIL